MKKERSDVKLLLIQARKDDVIRDHEVSCILKAGRLNASQLATHDLLSAPVDPAVADAYDGILIGGSGDFSVLDEVPNLASLEALIRRLRDGGGPPSYGACWGGQLMAKALGGEVIEDRENEEVGTFPVQLERGAAHDPVFSSLPDGFESVIGHHDRISRIPEGATLLASTPRCPVQAFVVPEAKMYGIQFHGELDQDDLRYRLERLVGRYVDDASGIEKIMASTKPTPVSATIVAKWVDHVVLPERGRRVLAD